MKFYYLLFLVVLSVWYQPGSCCEDNSPKCPGWKNYCKNEEYVKKNCQKTCDLCPGMCTGSYQEAASNAGNGKTRPKPQTKCVEYRGQVCHHDKGRWGSSWCYIDAKATNWGAECVPCAAPPPPQPGTCGIENTPDGRISGGQETEANQYPWMVQLPMGCGGSLITDRHVLTAKHCVMARNKDWRGKMVKFSVHDRTDRNDYEEVAIKDYVMPDAQEIGNHDIAIIILEKPVDLSDNTIGTVCLPASADKDYRGKSATAMGWGMTAKGTWLHTVLKHVNLKVSQLQKRNFLFTEVPVVNGVPQDPCAGDSGGPLVYQEESGRWTIIGTVYGGGYDCRTGNIDGKGWWNKVTDHLAWIHKVIGKK